MELEKTNGYVYEDDVAICVPPNKRSLICIALMVAAFGCNFSMRAFGVALPHIIENWTGAMQLYTIGSSLMTVALTITTIIVSRLSPRLGLKKTVGAGCIILLFCNFATCVAPNMLVFVILRVLTGIGNGCIIGQMQSTFSKVWPGHQRATWIGIQSIVQSFVSVIGPTISGMLVDKFGWQSTYYTISAFQLIGFIMFMIVTPKDTHDRFYTAKKFDTVGTILFTVVITAIVLACSFGNSLGWGSWQLIVMYVIIIAGFIFFAKTEDKAGETAVLPWNLFKKDKNFQKIYLITVLITMLCLAQTYFMALYLQKVAGTSATISGIPFTILSVGSLIASPIGAKIFNKTGRSKGLMIICSLMILLPVIYYAIFLSPETGASQAALMGVYIVSFIYGLGYIMTMTLPFYACSEYLKKEDIGTANSNVYMAVTLGATIGLAIEQIVMNAFTASHDLNIGLKAVFFTSAIFGVLAILVCLMLKPAKQEQE